MSIESEYRWGQDKIKSARSLNFYLKLSIVFLLSVIGVMGALNDIILLKVSAQIILGLVFAHMVELQHELLHGLGLPHGKLNKIIGFLIGLPMLVIYADYQYNHINHHKYLGTPQNKEFFEYNNSPITLKTFLKSLIIIPHLMNVFEKIFRAVCFSSLYFDAPKKIDKRICFQYKLLFVILLSLIAVLFTEYSHILLKVWIVPLVCIAWPIHFLIELPEHFECRTDNEDVLKNTRTIQTNKWMNWLTNGNNYHVEHHLMPRMPIGQLKELHQKIKPTIVYMNKSYGEFYLKFFKKMFFQLNHKLSHV